MYFLTKNAQANNTQTWFDLSKQPSLEKSWSMPASQFNTAVKQGYQPICKTFELYKNYLSRSIPLWRQQIPGCWYATTLGLVMHNGNYVAEPKSIIAGNVIYANHNSSDVSLKPTPKEGLFLEQRNHQNHSKRYLKFHYDAKLHTSYSLIGSATHTLTSKDTLTLENSLGDNVWLDGRGINYSKNGKWAVGATTNYALFRINLETKKIINFGEPIKSGPGWNPFMAVSVTNDGQYAVATGTASTGGQWMRIYNLNECNSGEQSVLTLHQAGCSYRDVTEFIRQNIPGFHRFTMAEFGNNDTLVFYHYNNSGEKTYTRYIMSAPHAQPRAKNYIALGDSFASGEGAYAYFKGTDEGSDKNNCHLSKLSYPYLLGEWLKIDSYHSVACSGARTRNIIGPESLIDDNLSEITKHTRTNQYLSRIDGNELGSRMPGYLPQIKFLKNENDNSPDTITISIIGNDIGFGKKIQRCLEPDTCYSSYEDRLELLREVYRKFDTLTGLYQELKDTADVNAKIYVIGYPEIGKNGGDCAVNVRLNEEEIEFANLLVERLNFTIKQAAARVGVGYVDVQQVFYGQRFCEDTNNPAINGLTAGDDVAYVIGNESYHPNIKGHQLYGQAIAEKTAGLSSPMPAPDPTVTMPNQEDDLVFLDRPKTNRKVMEINYDDDIANNIVYRENWLDVTYQSVENAFAPRSMVQIQLFSEPTDLGTTYANELGQIQTRVMIPTDTPTGFHTLHITGKNILNQKIDTYKIIYVAHTKDDKNGDDISDGLQPCGVFDASNLDFDEDGVDDACDNVIMDPPILEQAPNIDPKSNKPAVSTQNDWSGSPLLATPANIQSQDYPQTPTDNNTWGTATETVIGTGSHEDNRSPTEKNHPKILGSQDSSRQAANISTKATVARLRLLPIIVIGTIVSVILFTLMLYMRYAKNT